MYVPVSLFQKTATFPPGCLTIVKQFKTCNVESVLHTFYILSSLFSYILMINQFIFQCCGSVTLWCGSGFGSESADACL